MQSFLNSVGLLVVGAALTFLCAWFWHKKNAAVKEAERLASEHSKLEARVREMETQLSHVGASILPINAAFQAILVKQLTHFHTPRMDELMVKLGPPIDITEEEAEELAAALKERETDMGDEIDDSERDAARMLPMVIKRVKAEAEALSAAATQLQLVTVVPDAVSEDAEEKGGDGRARLD